MSVNPQAMKRLQNEFAYHSEFQCKKAVPPETVPHAGEGWSAMLVVDEAGETNMFLWNITIDGPQDTPGRIIL